MNVLVVEDNPADQLLVRTAFEKVTREVRLAMVEDGVEAMKYLRREGAYKTALKPHLILLDLNLPGKHGKEVLEEIKKDPRLKDISVVVLTSSSSRRDVCESYSRLASCYVVKPLSFAELLHCLRSLHQCWIRKSRYCACPSVN